MTTGEKIAKLRRESNHTQDQLAQFMGVSRQSISKWEADSAYPETEKLIKLSALYNCSLDYLLKENMTEDKITVGAMGDKTQQQVKELADMAAAGVETWKHGKKSARTVWGMPLWHIGKNAKGFIAIGLKAQGVISIGLCSVGAISIGVLSVGILSIGYFVSVGLLSYGCLALGLAAFGAISVGIITFGAISVGQFALGACSIGHYFAWGDYAKAIFAFGQSEAYGTVIEKVGKLTETEKREALQLMREHVPAYFRWMVALVKGIL